MQVHTSDDQADRLSVRPSNACIVTKQKQLVKQVQL